MPTGAPPSSLPGSALQTALSHGATRATVRLDHPALTADQVEEVVAQLITLRAPMKPAPRGAGATSRQRPAPAA